MYIIFHKDGSIHESQLSDYVNQNSDGVNFIDIAIVGVNQNEYTISGEYTLPNGDKLSYSAKANNKIVTSQDTYSGWTLTIYQALTEYSGVLALSIMAVQNEATLFTYPVEINVNKTAGGGKVAITHDEYKTLLSTIKDYQLQFSSSNVRGYDDAGKAIEDLTNLAEGQYALVNAVGAELKKVAKTADGNNAFSSVPVALETNRPYFVYTASNANPVGVVQSVGTGLSSSYTNADGNNVAYGTSDKKFSANVTTKSGAYTGEIELGATNYNFYTINMSGTKAYWAKVDGTQTDLRAPNGTSSVSLSSGKADIVANAITLGDGTSSSGNSIKVGVVEFNNNGNYVTFPSNQVEFRGRTDLTGLTKVDNATFVVSPTSLGNSVLADGAKTQALDPTLKNGVYADQNAVILKGVALAEADPTEDLGVATKHYVDEAIASGEKVKLNVQNGEGEGSLQTYGQDCEATGAHSFALGVGSKATGEGSVAIGNAVNNPYNYSLALGKNYTPSHQGFYFGVADNGTEVMSLSMGDGFRVLTKAQIDGNATIRGGADIYGSLNVNSGSATIQGNLSVGGTLTATKFVDIEAKTVSTSEYTVGLARGNEKKITSYIGLYATKYNGTDDGALVWDNTGTAYVGDTVVGEDGKITDPNNTLQPLMTRAESSEFTDGAFLTWEADKLRAVPSSFVTGSSNGVTISGGTSSSISVTKDKVSLVGAEVATPTTASSALAVANKDYVDKNATVVIMRVW